MIHPPLTIKLTLPDQYAAVPSFLEELRSVGGLLEPEEADKLEKEGYLGTRTGVSDATKSGGVRAVEMEEVEDEDEDEDG